MKISEFPPSKNYSPVVRREWCTSLRHVLVTPIFCITSHRLIYGPITPATHGQVTLWMLKCTWVSWRGPERRLAFLEILLNFSLFCMPDGWFLCFPRTKTLMHSQFASPAYLSETKAMHCGAFLPLASCKHIGSPGQEEWNPKRGLGGNGCPVQFGIVFKEGVSFIFYFFKPKALQNNHSDLLLEAEDTSLGLFPSCTRCLSPSSLCWFNVLTSEDGNSPGMACRGFQSVLGLRLMQTARRLRSTGWKNTVLRWRSSSCALWK